MLSSAHDGETWNRKVGLLFATIAASNQIAAIPTGLQGRTLACGDVSQ